MIFQEVLSDQGRDLTCTGKERLTNDHDISLMCTDNQLLEHVLILEISKGGA